MLVILSIAHLFSVFKRKKNPTQKTTTLCSCCAATSVSGFGSLADVNELGLTMPLSSPFHSWAALRCGQAQRSAWAHTVSQFHPGLG